MPVAFFLIATQPWDLPVPVYGLLITAAGCPVWFMVQAAAEHRGHSAYNLWSLRAQTWLQCGGATSAAVAALGDPDARHGPRGRRTPDD
jgi:hypothetical protein